MTDHYMKMLKDMNDSRRLDRLGEERRSGRATQEQLREEDNLLRKIGKNGGTRYSGMGW